MRRLGWLALVVLAGCGSKPYVGMAPSTSHFEVSFRAISTKLEFLQGERVVLAGYVKNESKRLRHVLIDPDPSMGATMELTLRGKDGEFKPTLAEPQPRKDAALDNSSFLVLDPGSEARVTVFEVREVTDPSGKKGALPAGDYTAKIRFTVAEKAGEGVKIQGDAAKYLAQAPRAVWEAEVSFKVSEERFVPPTRAPRGGGPSGG